MISSILNLFFPWMITVVPPSGIFISLTIFATVPISTKITYSRLFHQTVFLRNHTYQFVSLVSIIYGLYTFITAYGNRNNHTGKKNCIS